MDGEEQVMLSTDAGSVTVNVPVTENDEGIEVTQEWLESLFANVAASLATVSQGITTMLEQHSKMLEQLSNLESRLPGNLTQMISDQQTTITSLIREQQETVRSLLTPQAPPVEVVQEPLSEEVVNPVVPEPAQEPVRPRRRRI